jgi:hypothetical protein
MPVTGKAAINHRDLAWQANTAGCVNNRKKTVGKLYNVLSCLHRISLQAIGYP